MSFTLTLFGPRHYFWQHKWMAWLDKPNEHSSGGVGFNVPGLHVCFMWGRP